MNTRIAIVLGAVLCLAGCGTPGAPRPPSLHLPRTVGDLDAGRQGSTVTLSWTEPDHTTDGETIRQLGPTLICMGVNDYPMTRCDQPVADLSQSQFAPCAPKIGQAAACGVTLPAALQQQYPLGQATFAVEVQNANGRSAGLSNQVRVPLAPTLPPPSDVRAEVTPHAVVLTWTSILHEHEAPELRHEYRVLRRAAGAQAETEIGTVRLGTDPHAEFADRSFQWETTYVYRVQVVTSAVLPEGEKIEVDGDPSAGVTVTTKDVFPPATPTGLQAVASGVGQPPFIDLSWAPNTESDLAGYNVYRREDGEPWAKINAELVKAPAYRDNNVARGHKYFYAVAAVDLRANESGKSGEASEVVP